MALDILGEFALRAVFEAAIEVLGKGLRKPLYWTGWVLLHSQLRSKPPQHPVFCWAGLAFWVVFAGLSVAAYWYVRHGGA